MKIFIRIFISYLIVIPFRSHSQNIFHKLSYYPQYDSQNMAVDASNNIYISGTNNNLKIVLTKFSSNGNFVWSKEIGEQGRRQASTSILVKDSLIVIAGESDLGGGSSFRQMLVIGMDTSGTLNYIKVLGDTIGVNSYTPFKIFPTTGGFGIISNLQNNSINGNHFCTFDDAGNLILESSSSFPGYSIIILPDSSYLVADQWSFALIHYDRYFNNPVAKSFQYPNIINPLDINRLVESNNGEIYCVGKEEFSSAFIGHVNQNYECDVIHLIDSSANEMSILDMVQVPSGNWIALGTTSVNSFDESGFFLMKLDSNFTPISTVLLSDTFYLDPFIDYRLCKNSFDHFLFTASKHLNSAADHLDIFSTDSTFSGICSTISKTYYYSSDNSFFTDTFTLTVIPINSIISTRNILVTNISQNLLDCSSLPNEINLITDHTRTIVYPNPGNGLIKTDLENGTEYSIMDMKGEEIIKGIIPETGFIDISSLANGIYIFTSITELNKFTFKLIKTD